MPEFTKFLVVAEPTGASDSNRLALIPPQPVNVSVSNDMVYANVTDIFPGEEYRLGVRAVSESSGVQISSDLSALVSVFTHTTGMIMLPTGIDFVFCIMLLFWADHWTCMESVVNNTGVTVL